MNDCVKCKYEALLWEIRVNWDTVYDGDYDYTGMSYDGYYKTFRRDLSNGAVIETFAKSDEVEYDEYEGRVQEMWTVLKVTESDGTVLFFRKSGEANSYGNVSWGGLFESVSPVEKQVTEFESTFEVV